MRTSLISYLSFVVLIIVFIGLCGCLRLLFRFIVRCGCLRLLSDLLGGVVVCVCCRIYCSVSLSDLLFGFIVWCGCLRLLSDLLFGVVVCVCCSDLLGGAGVSAVGTTPLQSPGWNEGKARNATLGKHRQKRIELRRSGTHSERLVGVVAVCGFAFVGVVPPLQGSINVFQ